VSEKNGKQAPLSADEQDAPEPERPRTPQEEAGESLQEMDDPPQAEGDRDGSAES
jgi:hypothetical protein